MRQVWLLHNSRAGKQAYRAGVSRAAEALARRGVRVVLEQAGAIGALREAARRAVAAEADAVLVAGGDGTLGAIAAELAGTPVALGGLPAGTANVWARELRLPLPSPWRPNALEKAALLLLDSTARPTDLGLANGRSFLAWTGVGLDAYVTQQFELRRDSNRPLSGYLANALVTLKVSTAIRPVDVRVHVSGPDGERELAGRYVMVTVANIGLHGGGLLRITHDARLNDGLMDVWAVAADSYAELLAHFGRALRGRHLRHPGVTRLTGDRFEIYTAAPQVIHIDAEPQPATQQLSVAVAPGSLRVLVPTATARALYIDP
jgi:diacylglycerol kinase (ATP)